MSLNEVDSALFHLVEALRDSGYHFTTITPATHERVNSRPDNAWAKDVYGVLGWSRPFQPDVLPAFLFDLMCRADVAVRYGDGWRSRVRVSSLQGQLFLHSAYPTIEADSVFFGPDTYRYALALKNYFALNSSQVTRAVDVGCGAGPGALVTALAHTQAEVFAVDINEAALRLTRINAALAGTTNVTPRYSNLLSGVDGSFDLIVANPPYLVDPTERAYRHGGGPLGAGLSLAIVEAAVERLSPGGTLLLYTGAAIVDGADPFRDAIAERLPIDARWTYNEVDPDVFGEELLSPAYAETDRIAAVVLTMTKA